MLSIFLVEDEKVTREGIRDNVAWEKDGFKIVGDQSDGELAYPLIIKEKPDILITDIKMPFLDGLELSKLVKKELPDLKIIIISGYSDFSYAQEAIDIGISEYLLKPITPQRLMIAVKRVKYEIEKEREEKRIMEQYKQQVFEQRREKRNDFFNLLVSGKLSLLEILEKEKELGLSLVSSTFRILLFQFIGQGEIYEYSDSIVDLETKIIDMLTLYEGVRAFRRDMDGWAFIIMANNEEAVNELTMQIKEKMIDIAKNEFHYFGGIGRIVYRIRDIKQSYLDASKAFSMRYFDKKNQVLTYNEVNQLRENNGNNININELNLDKLDNNLIDNFLKNGIIQDVDNFVESYLSDLGANALKSVLFRQYVMLDVYFSVIKFLQQLDFSKDKTQDIINETNYKNNFFSEMVDCKEKFKDILTKGLELRNLYSQKRYAGMIDKAKDFIKDNYCQSDLSLNKVARYVNVSPNYFSSLFNQEEKTTFIEYLTWLRIEKAKEYLRCTSKRITEIGYQVGYQDSHYFSYVFKKIQNCTPKDYRKKGLSEE